LWLSLLAPLLLIQTFEAADLFCRGLAHASLLSLGCPHHSSTSHDADGGHAGTSHQGDEHHCNCPHSGSSLPDGLIQMALGGVGLPVAAIWNPEWRGEKLASTIGQDDPRPSLIPRSLDRPPRPLS
jgi:hypothetical protein